LKIHKEYEKGSLNKMFIKRKEIIVFFIWGEKLCSWDAYYLRNQLQCIKEKEKTLDYNVTFNKYISSKPNVFIC